MSNRAQKQLRGFSLIEIIVVLVIMGLLISVVAPTVLNSADDAQNSRFRQTSNRSRLR